MGTRENTSGAGNPQYPPAAINTAALAFYARYFKWQAIGNLLLILLLGLLLAWHIFTERREVDREYFGVDFKTGRMVRLIPLGDPYLSDQAMLARVQECIVAANTYDFVNYQRSFQSVSSCFTTDGWNAFATELKRVGTFDQVKQQRLNTKAVATGVPVIQGRVRHKGVLTWQIQMPLRLNFQGGLGGRGLATQNLLVTVTVQRVPEYENEYGQGITAYIAEERRE